MAHSYSTSDEVNERKLPAFDFDAAMARKRQNCGAGFTLNDRSVSETGARNDNNVQRDFETKISDNICNNANASAAVKDINVDMLKNKKEILFQMLKIGNESTDNSGKMGLARPTDSVNLNSLNADNTHSKNIYSAQENLNDKDELIASFIKNSNNTANKTISMTSKIATPFREECKVNEIKLPTSPDFDISRHMYMSADMKNDIDQKQHLNRDMKNVKSFTSEKTFPSVTRSVANINDDINITNQTSSPNSLNAEAITPITDLPRQALVDQLMAQMDKGRVDKKDIMQGDQEFGNFTTNESEVMKQSITDSSHAKPMSDIESFDFEAASRRAKRTQVFAGALTPSTTQRSNLQTIDSDTEYSTLKPNVSRFMLDPSTTYINDMPQRMNGLQSRTLTTNTCAISSPETKTFAPSINDLDFDAAKSRMSAISATNVGKFQLNTTQHYSEEMTKPYSNIGVSGDSSKYSDGHSSATENSKASAAMAEWLLNYNDISHKGDTKKTVEKKSSQSMAMREYNEHTDNSGKNHNRGALLETKSNEDTILSQPNTIGSTLVSSKSSTTTSGLPCSAIGRSLNNVDKMGLSISDETDLSDLVKPTTKIHSEKIDSSCSGATSREIKFYDSNTPKQNALKLKSSISNDSILIRQPINTKPSSSHKQQLVQSNVKNKSKSSVVSLSNLRKPTNTILGTEESLHVKIVKSTIPLVRPHISTKSKTKDSSTCKPKSSIPKSNIQVKEPVNAKAEKGKGDSVAKRTPSSSQLPYKNLKLQTKDNVSIEPQLRDNKPKSVEPCEVPCLDKPISVEPCEVPCLDNISGLNQDILVNQASNTTSNDTDLHISALITPQSSQDKSTIDNVNSKGLDVGNKSVDYAPNTNIKKMKTLFPKSKTELQEPQISSPTRKQQHMNKDAELLSTQDVVVKATSKKTLSMQNRVESHTAQTFKPSVRPRSTNVARGSPKTIDNGNTSCSTRSLLNKSAPIPVESRTAKSRIPLTDGISTETYTVSERKHSRQAAIHKAEFESSTTQNIDESVSNSKIDTEVVKNKANLSNSEKHNVLEVNNMKKKTLIPKGKTVNSPRNQQTRNLDTQRSPKVKSKEQKNAIQETTNITQVISKTREVNTLQSGDPIPHRRSINAHHATSEIENSSTGTLKDEIEQADKLAMRLVPLETIPPRPGQRTTKKNSASAALHNRQCDGVVKRTISQEDRVASKEEMHNDKGMVGKKHQSLSKELLSSKKMTPLGHQKSAITKRQSAKEPGADSLHTTV